MCLLLQRIDDLSRFDHSHLRSDHECYFLWEYYAGAGYQASKTNQLIFNLKKSPLKKNQPEWVYKGKAIREAALCLGQVLVTDLVRSSVLVPIPPSKSCDDPEYDDRMCQVARRTTEGCSIQVCEALERITSQEACHQSGGYRRIDTVKRSMRFNRSAIAGNPKRIWLLDDVITSGAHFVACHQLIAEQLPGVRVCGLFLARSVHLPEDEEPISDDF